MIDINEPIRRKYSSEEEIIIKKKFLILVHSFLLLYLSLHNFLIPVVMNFFRGNPLIQDVHFWFLFHLPVHFSLRNGKQISSSYNMFLILGSLARFAFYHLFLFSRSWSLVSVYLSEVSSLFFCFLIWDKTSKDRWTLLSLIGFFVPFALGFLEVHPEIKKDKLIFVKENKVKYTSYGCQGSLLNLNFNQTVLTEMRGHTSLTNCGFDKNLAKTNKNFEIRNSSKKDVNLRLYSLSKKNERYSWKFQKILRIPGQTKIQIAKYLNESNLYLLKSPERKELGIHVLINGETSLKGSFEITSDTLSWRLHE